ncbi:MAG: HEAT repeat domain-containing protein [Bdellovibrionota bacterium]
MERFEHLLALVGDSNSGVAEAVAKALGEMGSEAAPAVDRLRATLEVARAEAEKLAVVEALGKIGSNRAVPSLIPLLRSARSPLKRVAARALGNIGDPEALPALISSLSERDEDVRMCVINALLHVGAPAIPALESERSNPDKRLRAGVEHVLARIRP